MFKELRIPNEPPILCIIISKFTFLIFLTKLLKDFGFKISVLKNLTFCENLLDRYFKDERVNYD